EDATLADSNHDFGKDLLPRLVARGEAVYAYHFRDYWQDVGALDTYYQSNMDLLSDRPPLDLSDPSWLVHTQSADRPPVRFEAGGRAERSLIANGCRVAGRVVRSVLFPGVTVLRGATVTDSILMHDTTVGKGAAIDRAILDKEVVVGAGGRIGWGEASTPGRACPEHLSNGLLVVGKGAHLPEQVKVGGKTRIGAQVAGDDFSGDAPAGGDIHGPDPGH